jgi:hypothetical protein
MKIGDGIVDPCIVFIASPVERFGVAQPFGFLCSAYVAAVVSHEAELAQGHRPVGVTSVTGFRWTR